MLVSIATTLHRKGKVGYIALESDVSPWSHQLTISQTPHLQFAIVNLKCGGCRLESVLAFQHHTPYELGYGLL